MNKDVTYIIKMHSYMYISTFHILPFTINIFPALLLHTYIVAHTHTLCFTLTYIYIYITDQCDTCTYLYKYNYYAGTKEGYNKT